MAKCFGKKDQYILKNLMSSSLFVLFYSLFCLLFAYYIFLVVWYHAYSSSVFVICFVIVFVLASLYFKYKKADLKSKQYSHGWKGELTIGEELKKLSDDYSIYSDVKIKFGNIDYVVIGPTGLYTIEVKSHKGVFEVVDGQLIRNGRPLEKDFLKQAKDEKFQLDEYIKLKLGVEVHVKPVIVFANYAKMKFGLKSINDVHIVSKIWLNKLIQEQSDYYFPIDHQKVESELELLVNN